MNPTFRTTDLDLGAAILTAGIPLSDLHRNGDTRMGDSFDDAQECCEVIRREFAAGTLTQPSCELLRNLRSLKWKLHQTR